MEEEDKTCSDCGGTLTWWLYRKGSRRGVWHRRYLITSLRRIPGTDQHDQFHSDEAFVMQRREEELRRDRERGKGSFFIVYGTTKEEGVPPEIIRWW